MSSGDWRPKETLSVSSFARGAEAAMRRAAQVARRRAAEVAENAGGGQSMDNSVPAGTADEGTTIIESLKTLREAGLRGSAEHLREASECINRGDWAGSIRESIHAVESVARQIAPEDTDTLTQALNSIDNRRPLHSNLKEGLKALYWYTSDEQGLRHSLLDREKASVGTDEAVFMLGACASFASYLWRKHAAGGVS